MAAAPLTGPSRWLRQPRQAMQAQIAAWMMARLPPQDSLSLTQRQIYILPTRAGWMLLLTLAVLLLAAINYQINLGYLLTFMLAGAATIGMYVCHGNLRGLKLQLQPPEPCFVGQDARLHMQLHNPSRRGRYGIGLAMHSANADAPHWAWLDVPPQGSAALELRWAPTVRGWHSLPRIDIETRYPLGTFKVWSYWRAHSRVLAYPQPEQPCPPLPVGQASASGSAAAAPTPTGEFDGLRPYRRGDTQKQIVWKKMAKSGELISREAQELQQHELWLDSAQCGGQLPHEARLSRLTAWVLKAEAQQQPYGLRLGAFELPPDWGPQHQRACLQALALA